MNTIIEKIRAEIERLQHTDIPHTDEWWDGADYVRRRMKEVLSDLEKDEKPTNPTIQEQPVKTNIVEDLKHYLATTPKEQIEKDWESLKEWDKVGPSVSEFLEWEKPVCEGLEEEIERHLSTEWELDEDLNKDEPIYIYDCTWEDLKILARHFAQWGAEHAKKETPVTDDLEEAADEYASEPDGFIDLTAYRAFIAGAKWQAEQDQETIELAEDHAYLAGAVNEREKIMKEAVEGEVTETCGIASVWIKTKQFKPGQKVRIIVCKKED